MTKVQKADPDLPSRSDSFLRMLDLERRYKMQRTQGHAPPTITSPSTSSPSAQSKTPFKARRASGHPPLSHQTQIMKAVRRNSALPSLSISIPPSPTDGPTVGAEGPLGEPPSKNGERIKTVTFSGPGDDKNDEKDENEDEGAASDQSSICQSPSWEQYGRKKQKKPKKRDSEQPDKKSKEKSASTTLVAKKGKRLSKVPPPHVQGVDSLAATDRSQSAPELAMYLKSNTGNVDTPKPTPPITMVNQKANGKPKSKGFLSSFRLQHGNVAAVQKIIDTQQGSIDGNSAPGSPMFKPHPAVEPNFTNPRKPPSIRSAVSNSTRSISSLDQLPATRHLSNSSHGRSQSLLSSTLSKLKGPSYLYFRPAEGTEEARAQRPSSSQRLDVIPNWSNDQPAKRPIERQQESPEALLMPPSEPQQQQIPQFSFPSQPRQAPVQPTANIAARRVQNQAHFAEPSDIDNGYEQVEPTSFRNRQAQMPPPRAPSRESGLEREMRARSDRVPRTSRQYIQQQQVQQVESSRIEENRAPPPRQPNRAFERQYRPIRQSNGYIQPRVESWEESKHGPELSGEAHHSGVRLTEHQVSFDGEEEEDRVSVGTHASTIRPHSRRQGSSPPETNGRKHVTFPPSPNGIGTAITSDAFDMEEPAAVIESPEPEKPVRKEEVVRIEKPRSADYFSFINQSYSPPALELKSPPLDGKFPSPRIDEEPEEDDDDLDHVLRHMAIRGEVNEVSLPSEIVNQAAAPHTNATSKATRQRPAKNSPSMSSHYSDSDIPAFERLGLSPKAARILAGVETSSTSTSQSNTDPSRSTSEGSSSSTCDDSPPTPDSSRPQSRKGDNASSAAIIPSMHNCARSYCGVNCELTTLAKSYQSQVAAPTTKQSVDSAKEDTNIQDESWSRTALPIDLDNQLTEPPFIKPSSQTPTPPLVATPTSVTFAEDVKEKLDAEDIMERNPYQRPIPPRAQSALELHSVNFEPGLKNPPLYTKKAKAGLSSISLPNSPPSDPADAAPRKSAMRMSRKPNSEPSSSSSALVSPGAAYLQEARKAAQLPTPPTAPPPSRALRPHYAHKNSSTSIKSATTGGAEPLAKMLVECCNCNFFHDMPSRVYECMAKPDSLVEDKLLGVSATITTMVKCPWCAHGMTTQCCAGYAAVVYLKEKLHGK
ncbi:hypothetical protein GGR53DRAFT_462739 [Hypoxylon sp. FL1150]|nr:hypothetical protein GGR53DRAFT_462739 [Hypoxylon sp. FL1150]